MQVAKIRSQRCYKVEFLDSLRLASILTLRKNAAAIEVTQLQLQGQPWWTIAYKYLGDNIRVEEQFLPLVRSLLFSYPLLMSKPIISCGYPRRSILTRSDFSNFTG